MFEIFLNNASKKALKNIDKRIAKKVTKALIDLKSIPLPVKEYDLKKVSGEQDTYRLRISKYRIVYDIDWSNRVINILKIEKKDEETYRLK